MLQCGQNKIEKATEYSPLNETYKKNGGYEIIVGDRKENQEQKQQQMKNRHWMLKMFSKQLIIYSRESSVRK